MPPKKKVVEEKGKPTTRGKAGPSTRSQQFLKEEKKQEVKEEKSTKCTKVKDTLKKKKKKKGGAEPKGKPYECKETKPVGRGLWATRAIPKGRRIMKFPPKGWHIRVTPSRPTVPLPLKSFLNDQKRRNATREKKGEELLPMVELVHEAAVQYLLTHKLKGAAKAEDGQDAVINLIGKKSHVFVDPHMNWENPYASGSDWYLLNHSRTRANVEPVVDNKSKWLEFRAKRAILPKEELLFDYGKPGPGYVD